MDQVDPGKELLTRSNGQPYHRLFHPDLPTCEGSQHVKNLVNSAEQRCKEIAGKAVTKVDFYSHMTVINNNDTLILRCNPVWNNNSSWGAASCQWFDWVEVNWLPKICLTRVVPAILCLWGKVTKQFRWHRRAVGITAIAAEQRKPEGT
jgi:hypothetical protein